MTSSALVSSAGQRQLTDAAARSSTSATLRGPDATTHDTLVKQTQIWVGQTFFGTMLKQMRDSPFKSELFDGGRGGQAFGSMMDQHLAERMARGAGQKLVTSIVKKIEAKRAYEKAANTGKGDNRKK